jgi:hypothetical protein
MKYKGRNYCIEMNFKLNYFSIKRFSETIGMIGEQWFRKRKFPKL